MPQAELPERVSVRVMEAGAGKGISIWGGKDVSMRGQTALGSRAAARKLT